MLICLNFWYPFGPFFHVTLVGGDDGIVLTRWFFGMLVRFSGGTVPPGCVLSGGTVTPGCVIFGGTVPLFNLSRYLLQYRQLSGLYRYCAIFDFLPWK